MSVLLLALCLSLWTRGLRADAPACSQPRLGMQLGVNVRTLSREAVDSVASELHLGWIRTDVEWAFHASEARFRADVAAARKGALWPDLASTRAQIRYAHGKGLKILAVVMSAPSWVRGADRVDGGNPWHQAILPRHRRDFAEYVHQVCLAGADAVELLNEPNLKSEYSFGPEHPRAGFPDERVDDYVLLVQTVSTRLRADPRTRKCRVGLGGVSAGGHEMVDNQSLVHPTEWYRRLFHARADDRRTRVSIAGWFDFAAVHPYAETNTRSGPTEWGHRWTRFFFQYGDAAYSHGVAAVHRVRQVLVAEGEGDKKIWATEAGAPTYGGACRSKPCVSLALQSAWVDQYMRAWFSTGRTGWKSPLASRFYGAFSGPLFFYQWKDRSDGKREPRSKEGFFGLLRYDGSKKPAFERLARHALSPHPSAPCRPSKSPPSAPAERRDGAPP